MVVDHGHEDCRRIFSWFIPREILLESSLVYGPDTSIFIIIRNLKNIGS